MLLCKIYGYFLLFIQEIKHVFHVNECLLNHSETTEEEVTYQLCETWQSLWQNFKLIFLPTCSMFPESSMVYTAALDNLQREHSHQQWSCFCVQQQNMHKALIQLRNHNWLQYSVLYLARKEKLRPTILLLGIVLQHCDICWLHTLRHCSI